MLNKKPELLDEKREKFNKKRELFNIRAVGQMKSGHCAKQRVLN